MSVHQIHDFLAGLAANNHKEWMDAHRAEYLEAKQHFESLVDQVIAQVSAFDKDLTGLRAKDCIFRINRDIRFSKNKEPYKTNFGASIMQGGRKSGHPGYYLHIKPGENFVGGGLYMPPAEELKKIRQEIDYNGDELMGILEDPSFKKAFPEQHGEQLKTAPKGYPKDHPHIEQLRYKSFIFLHRFTDSQARSADFLDQITGTIKVIKPVIDFLRRGLD